MEKQNVNVYDFDGTIYDGHSSIEFFIYCLINNPGLISYVPKNIIELLKLRSRLSSVSYDDINYCDFLKEIDNIDLIIEGFWRINRRKIKKWYLEKRRENDIVVTASPEFLVKYICDELGVKYLLATKCDKHTGIIDGKLCFNGNKIQMFSEAFPDAVVDNCYTDSVVDDAPLLSLAKNKYKVKGNIITKID